MNHALVTVAVRFAAERTRAVIAVLEKPISKAQLDNTGIVHFMSLSVVPNTSPGLAHVMLELSADGGPAEALEAVCHAIGPVIEEALDVAGVDRGGRSPAEFLLSNNLRLGHGWRDTLGIGFAGAPYLTVRRIKEEARLVVRITTEMPDLMEGPLPADEKLARVRERLWHTGEKWAFSAEPTPFFQPGLPRSIPRVALMAAITLAKLSWPLLPVPLLLWWWLGFRSAAEVSVVAVIAGLALIVWYLRRLETSDPVDDSPPDASRMDEIMLLENTGAQNLMAAVSIMKPGYFRRFLLRLAFGIAAESVANIFRPGYLREIGVIHFARWVLIPGTDTLAFYSNFSDSWESYLEDFIEKAGSGLTAVWSNTKGFPRTRLLFGGGADDGDRFRRWARRQQYVVQFWYSAYPDLKMNRVRRNAAIRQGIAAARTKTEAEDWLSCFGSEPRPASALEKPEVPTLVLGGLSRLTHSACMILHLPDDVDAARSWLNEYVDDITFGEVDRNQPATAIAFTANGLLRLGIAAEDLATFPPAFQNGMTAPWRARALGDIGPNAPEHWEWGAAAQTDAILILFDPNGDMLTRRMAVARESAKRHGGAAVYTKTMKELPPKDEIVFEPFGFADGLSQPILRDTPRARGISSGAQVVDAGEFVLGYPDNRGYVPPTPTVAAGHDPLRILGEIASSQTSVRPSFTGGGSNGYRDFGRNGTFLVVRHLEQDVEAFHSFSSVEAKRLSNETGCAFAGQVPERLQRLLEAKMVGRWHDGGSLVRYNQPETQTGPSTEDAKTTDQRRVPDNEFTFGREDPQGMACPFGAHIRRANPRDSLDTDAASQMALSNRHRIIRVGRQYEASDDTSGAMPGLMFMCLNVDIERQFEFLQQTWVLGRNFHDLQDEADPLMSRNSGTGVFTIPTLQGPVQLRGLPDFVHVRGGGYFFMPGRRALRFLVGGNGLRRL
jgi:deferrochelatase/peroxidase EfeB